MAREGQTFRVFVSSTFSDLKAERNALQERVFPRLKQFCAQRGARFQAIDLRWGVSQQASRDQRTMNICLSEIARCQEVTPRPNFIVLLGDRYGWCTPPPQIPAKEFDEILVALETEDQPTSSEKRLLLWEEDGGEPDDGVEMVQWDDNEQAFVGDKGWYRRDENAEPAEYVLQPWDGFTYEEWEEIEEDLHAALERGARAAGLDDGALFKYWASATHQEIAAGAMSVPDADEHVFAFFRHIDDPPKNEEAEGFIDLVEAEEGIRPDADAKERLLDLKADLGKTLGEENVQEYEVEWTDGGPSTDHIDRLCDDVYQALSSVIENQLADLEQIDPLEAEIAAHEAFGEERAEFFTGRAAYLRRIADYVEDASPHPFALWGESGSGKSALLAKAVEETQEAHPEAELIYRFIGATPESSSGRALLEGLCRQIYEVFDFEEQKKRALDEVKGTEEEKQEQRQHIEEEYAIPLEYRELSTRFRQFLKKVPPRDELILFSDALDQLSDMDNAKALTWLPAELPENVRLVVSTVPGDCRDVLERKLPPEGLLQLEPMPEDEAAELLNLWLKDTDRELQAEQRRDVLTNPKPLYLKLAFEEARRWHSYDGLPKGTDGVPGLSDDIEGVIGDLFARLSSEANHGEMLVSRSLGYLAAAKNGLTENELLDVLARDVEVYTWFLATLFHTPPDLLRAAQAHLERERKEPVSEEMAEAWLKKLREGEDEKRLRDFLSTVLTEGDGLRLPVVLWSRLYADLEPYLTQQSADGTSLLSFYHPTTFGRAVKAEYLSEHVRQTRHRALARYFDAQPLIRADGGEQRTNLRKLSELPYQQAYGRQWEKVKRTLTDFDFLQAKVSAVGHQPLIEDYDIALVDDYEDRDLSLVQGALQLSAHVLAREESTLAGELVGRLLAHEAPEIQGLLEQAKGWKGAPWLRPLSPVLTPPGGPLIRTLEDEGYNLPIKAMAVTPDGRRAVSGYASSYAPYDTIRVWDLKTGEQLRSVEGYGETVNAIAVTPDGRRAISSSRGNTLKVWDIERGEEIRTLRGHRGTISGVAVTDDGARAVSASSDGTLKVWNLEDGKELCTLKGHVAGVNAVAVTRDGDWIVSGSQDQTLKVWDLERGEELVSLGGHADAVSRVAATPDGSRAVSYAEDQTLKLWDLETGEELRTPVGPVGWVWAIAVTPDGTHAICGLPEGDIKVWDLERGEEICTLEGHTDGVNGAEVIHGGKRLVSASGDATLKVWDLERVGTAAGTVSGHQGRVTGIAALPGGDRAVSCSYDGTLKVWDVSSGAVVDTLSPHAGLEHSEARALAVAPDGTRAVSGHGGMGGDYVLRVWDLKRGVETGSLKGHTSLVSAVAVTPDGRRAVSGSYDATLKVWDLERCEELRSLAGHEGPVSAVAVTPGGGYAMSGSLDTIRCWDLRSGAENQAVRGQLGVTSVAVSPDLACVVFGTEGDFQLKVWRLETDEPEREEVRTLYHHAAPVEAVSVSPDGLRVVSASRDKTLRVWDLQSGDEIAHVRLEGEITACATGPDGLTFIAGDEDGRVHFLRLENITPNPAIVTALRTEPDDLTARCALCVDCVRCRARRLIEESDWGSIIACPRCGAELRVNPFVVDVSATRVVAHGSGRDETGGRPDRETQAREPTRSEDNSKAPTRTTTGKEIPSGRAQDSPWGSLGPGARMLCFHAGIVADRYGHEERHLHHYLLALLERHGAMVESLVPGLDPSDYRRQLEQGLQEGETGAPVEPQTLLGEALARGREQGKEQASERDLAAVLLKRAGQFPPAKPVEPAGGGPQPVPTETSAIPPLPLSFSAEQLIQSAFRQHDAGESGELDVDQWLATLLDEHRGLAEDAAEGRDLDALRRALTREAEQGTVPQDLATDVLVDLASERARAADRQVVRPQDVAAAILAAAVRATTGTAKVSATVETRADVPQLPLSFGAEQMIRAALRFNDKLETSEMGASQWLVALISQHRELLEDLAGARDLKDLEARVRQQLDRGEIGAPLTQDAVIDQASRKAEQASRQVVTPRDVARVILASDPHTSRLMHRG
jgi:WD40 repeat protein